MKRTNGKLRSVTNKDDPIYDDYDKELPEKDKSIERDIVIGLITQDEICEFCNQRLDTELLQARPARKMASIALEYHQKYNKAPGSTFEKFYFDKLTEGELSPDEVAEWEEDLLPDLDKEYRETGIDVEHLKDRILTYRKKRLGDEAGKASKNGEFERARELLDEIDAVDSKSLDHFMLTADQWQAKELPKPKLLMKPWLREGQTNFFYAGIGTGKTLLAMAVGYTLGCENYDEPICEIGDWQVREPVGVVYIDGELGEADLRARYNEYRWLGEQEIPMRLFPRPDVERELERTFDLSEQKNQRWLLTWLKNHSDYKVVIIDSIQTLFSFESENDNAEWNQKVTPLLRGFRSLGVGHIILDHTGKDYKKGIRGASAKQAIAENIFQLKDHPNKVPGQAWFTVSNEGKQRTYGIDLNKPFTICFGKDELDGETYWEVTDEPRQTQNNQNKIIADIINGDKYKVIAERYGLSTGRISQIKKKARKDGLLNEQDEPTRQGFNLLNEVEGE